MKKLITLAVVTAGIAYLVKRRKQQSFQRGGIIQELEEHDIEVGEPVFIATSAYQSRIQRMLKQEAESQRIRNKILPGGVNF